MTRVLRSVLKTGARHKEPEVVDFESVFERVARLITHQDGARGRSSPDSWKIIIRQPSRLYTSAKSDQSAGSDMRSGSLGPEEHVQGPELC